MKMMIESFEQSCNVHRESSICPELLHHCTTNTKCFYTGKNCKI